MTVPYAFGAATSAIPLSQLDSNFNTPITLGNTAIQLGNTVTTLNNMTLANVTISSGNVTITNVTVTTANATTVNTTTLIATTANVTTGNVTNLISGNVSLTGGTITGTPISGSTGSFTTLTTSSTVTLNGGTAGGVAYLDGSKVLTSGSALTFDGTRATIGSTNIYDNAMLSITTPSQLYSLIVDGGTTSNKSRGGFYHPSANVFALNADSSASLAFTLNTSEQMRLTSTGLGIGTSSPGVKLDVVGELRTQNTSPAGITVKRTDGVNANGWLNFVGSDDVVDGSVRMATDVANALTFLTASTERLRLDSSGNLGLGVTPSAWRSTDVALQVRRASLWDDGSNAMYLGQNVYENTSGSYIYIGSDYASVYRQQDGAHAFYTAASGTAGNAITFTQAMTLDASGNLGIGTTSPSQRLEIAAASPRVRITDTDGGYAQIEADNGNLFLVSDNGNTVANSNLTFGVDGTERARITSGGDFGVGTTSPAARLDLGTPGNVRFINAENGVDANFRATFSSNTVTFANTGGSGVLAFQTGGSERARIDSSGRLLVGPTTARALDSSTSTITPVFEVEGVTADSSSASLVRNTASNAGPVLFLGKSRSGALGGVTVVQNGDQLGQVIFEGADGTNLIEGALIRGEVDGTPGTNDMPGRLVFSTTADGASSPTERARIDSSGRLLVGKTSAGDFVTGVEFQPAGAVLSYRSSAVAGIFGRTDNGETIRLTNNGNTVGTISTTGSATAYNTSSDYRLKDNQQPLTGSGAFIDALQPKTWNWKADGSKGVGFIAHEAQVVSPSSVLGEKDAVDEDGKPIMQAMEYGSAEFIANIIAELQSLRARVAALESNP